MKPFLAVLKRELKGYIDQPMAYILAIVFLVLNNFFFFRSSFIEQIASLRSMFQLLPWVLLFFISALTMRTWAEERRENTLGVLLSYPVKVWQLILGKYLATVIYVLAVIALTLIIPLSMSSIGSFDAGVILAQYLGTAFLVMAMVAIGQWASSLTKNQVIAFIISVAVLFVFVVVGLDTVVLAAPYPLNMVLQQLGLLAHYQSLIRGLLDLRDLFYFLSIAFSFLALSFLWLNRLKRSTKTKAWKTLQGTIATLIAIAVVINLFGQSFTVRLDLTQNQLYSLSNATKSTLHNLDDTVTLTLYRSKKLPTQVELVSRDLQDMLRDYEKFSGGKVQIAVKYPDDDQTVVQEAQQNGITPVRFNVVQQDQFTLQQGYLGLVISYLDKHKSIPFVQKTDDLEYRLTKAILALKSDKKPTLGYVSDFGGKTQDQLGSFTQALQDSYTVQPVALATADDSTEAPTIPDSVDVLFIAGPTQKFSDQAVQAIKDYADNGGKIFWMVSGVAVDQSRLSVAANTTGLESILSDQGVQIQTSLVGDLASHETVNFSSGQVTYLLPYPFWIKAAVQKHVIAGNVQQIMLPWPSEIKASPSDNVQILATTTNSGVAQTSSYSISPDTLDQLTGLDQSQRILALSVKDIDSSTDTKGRWVVFADNDFLADNILQQYPQNAAIALNAFDWLAQNEALLTIRTKNAQPPALVWTSDSQKSWVKWGNVAGIPLLVAAFGFVWIFRRKRRARTA